MHDWLGYAYRERWHTHGIQPESDEGTDHCNRMVAFGWLRKLDRYTYEITATGVAKIEGRTT